MTQHTIKTRRRANCCIGVIAAMATITAPVALGQSWGKSSTPLSNLNATWSFESSAGAEYDSNVSVSQLETTTGVGDNAFRLRARAGVQTKLGRDTAMKFGYTLSDKRYTEFSQYNLQTHIFSGLAKHDFGPVTAGTAVRYIDASLGGEGFQSITQLAPYASGRVTKNLLLRGTVTLAEKQFATRTDRDASVQTLDAKAYYFLDGSRRYILAGVETETSQANVDQFSYDSVGAQIRFSQRFKVRGRTARAQARWRYESRDFVGETPSIAAIRQDDRTRIDTRVEMPITDTVFIAGEYEWGDFTSNLPSANYTQNVVSFRTGTRF